MTNNIKLSYHKEGFEVHAAINNIFGVEYSEYGSLSWNRTPGYYPSPRLNASMGLKYRF
jgi:outer membrane receptor protein involved in Fe transport